MYTESSSEEYAREVITKQSSSTPIVLTIEDIASIFERLKSASNDWFTLGLAFGLEFSVLKDIEDQYRTNNRRLTEVVAVRLQVHPMTWPYICECLRSPTVERNDVANEIEGKVLLCSSNSIHFFGLTIIIYNNNYGTLPRLRPRPKLRPPSLLSESSCISLESRPIKIRPGTYCMCN